MELRGKAFGRSFIAIGRDAIVIGLRAIVIGLHGQAFGLHGQAFGLHGKAFGRRPIVFRLEGTVFLHHGQALGFYGKAMECYGKAMERCGKAIGRCGKVIGRCGKVMERCGKYAWLVVGDLARCLCKTRRERPSSVAVLLRRVDRHLAGVRRFSNRLPAGSQRSRKYSGWKPALPGLASFFRGLPKCSRLKLHADAAADGVAGAVVARQLAVVVGEDRDAFPEARAQTRYQRKAVLSQGRAFHLEDASGAASQS